MANTEGVHKERSSRPGVEPVVQGRVKGEKRMMASTAPPSGPDELRAFARTVAQQLREGGVSPGEVVTTTEREEEQPAGFLGMKKKNVKVADTASISMGWRLWSQMMDDALYLSFSRPVDQVSNELQLWLREDGELVALQFYRDHVVMADRHVEQLTIREATDAELQYADSPWHEVEESGYPNPSVQYKRFWTNGGEQPAEVPYAGLYLRLIGLVGGTA